MPLLNADDLNALLTELDGHDLAVVEEVTEDRVVLKKTITEANGRPGGTVSGPAMMSLADQTAWMAVLAQIGPVLMAVTTSLHIDFLRRPALDDLVATGVVLKCGRRLAVVDVTLSSVRDPRPVAKAQVTYSLPPQA